MSRAKKADVKRQMSGMRRSLVTKGVLAAIILFGAVLLASWLPGHLSGFAGRSHHIPTNTYSITDSGDTPDIIIEKDFAKTQPLLAPTVGGASGGTTVLHRQDDRDVTSVAIDILAEYDRCDNCVLADAGYLDLMGRVWGCTVQGAGWVELCSVRAGADHTTSDVTVVHMSASEWGADLEEVDEAP